MTESYDRAYWEQHYESRASAPHPQVNVHVVGVAQRLPAGTALDVGCGDGGDVLWLASRGWQVTAMDVSSVVLDRARQRTASLGTGLGADVDAAIDWVESDLLDWQPRPERYDLVSAQYVHVPAERLAEFAGRLLDAVAPGGSLVVADHAHAVAEGSPEASDHPLTDAVLAALATLGWAVDTHADSSRHRGDAEGHHTAGRVHGRVVVAVRSDPART